MMRFSLALVTGATSGIGYSLAHLLADQGIDLILTGRDRSQLETLEKDLSKKVSVTTIEAHLEDPMSRQPLHEIIKSKVPDLLINNAGLGLYGIAAEQSFDVQKAIVEVNCEALLELTLLGASTLKSQKKRGVIMNVSSVLAYASTPGMAVYGASKTFVLNLSKALDYELAPFGIRVLTNCPGQVTTAFVKRASGKENSIRRGPILDPDFVAKKIWEQIEKRKRVSIVDGRYKALVFAMRYLIPEKLMNKILLKSGLERL